mgnify:CR=1 FL=1
MIDKGLYKNGRIQARTGYAGEQYGGGSSNNNNTSGGGDGQRERQISQQYSQPRSVAPKTTSDDPMDIREQYRINPNLIMGGLASGPRAIISPIDRTAADQFSAYGRNRFARNLEPSFTQKLGMGIGSVFDYIPYVGTIKKFAEKFGPTNIKDFYTEKVVPAGKLDTSKYKDFDEYLEARMAGEIDAYGNPINSSGGGGISTLPLFTQTPVSTGVETLEEEPQEMSFLERLRQNLGLV